jgi:hypothetical protein
MKLQARIHLRDIGYTTFKLHPDMTQCDEHLKRLHFEWMFSGMPHKDGHFIEPGILKDDGTRAIDEARIARCNRWHKRHHQRDLQRYFERKLNEQRSSNLDPAA